MEEISDESQKAVCKIYSRRLRSSNLIDCFDLLNIVKTALDEDGSTLSDLAKSFFATSSSPTCIVVKQANERESVEADLLRLLLSTDITAKVTKISVDPSSNVTGVEEDLRRVNVALENFPITGDSFKSEPHEAIIARDPNSASASERYCLQWAEGCLRLVVNSRDELALARVICGPLGLLDESAFAVIRREAAKTGMPIFQTLISYVNKLRLGGKSYAPTEDHPFYPFNKELCELVDLTDKLQAKIEDEATEESAMKKVVSAIKSYMQRNSSLGIKIASVEKCSQKLTTLGLLAIRADSGRTADTPKRAVGSGGSIVGRRNMKVRKEFSNFVATYV